MGFITLIGMSIYQLVFGKAYPLPIEFEHKALWTLHKLNMNWKDASNPRVEMIHELDYSNLWGMRALSCIVIK